MIRDARQLKAKIQQLANGDSLKSQIYLRNFFMERFLERISISPYRTSFVLIREPILFCRRINVG